MVDTVAWLDAAPEFELDGDGVRVTCRSGEAVIAMRISRANFRLAVEMGERVLAQADRAEVIRFPIERTA